MINITIDNTTTHTNITEWAVTTEAVLFVTVDTTTHAYRNWEYFEIETIPNDNEE